MEKYDVTAYVRLLREAEARQRRAVGRLEAVRASLSKYSFLPLSETLAIGEIITDLLGAGSSAALSRSRPYWPRL